MFYFSNSDSHTNSSVTSLNSDITTPQFSPFTSEEDISAIIDTDIDSAVTQMASGMLHVCTYLFFEADIHMWQEISGDISEVGMPEQLGYRQVSDNNIVKARYMQV